jgi:hypothetical protein
MLASPPKKIAYFHILDILNNQLIVGMLGPSKRFGEYLIFHVLKLRIAPKLSEE